MHTGILACHNHAVMLHTLAASNTGVIPSWSNSGVRVCLVRILFRNESERTVKLVDREWKITDSNGMVRFVR